MTIAELLEKCIDPSMCRVEIWDTTKEDTVWKGWGDELPDEYGEMDVESFDVPTDACLVFNI